MSKASHKIFRTKETFKAAKTALASRTGSLISAGVFGLLIAGSITSGAQGSSSHQVRHQEQRPVADPHLESRLTQKKIYQVRTGDTLNRAAHLLYGHSSWWKRLRKMNPSLARLGPHDPIPAGTKLRYLGPEIGESYVVRKNDWLVRIAEWKYGSSDRWTALYQKNAERIRNPNLIHPGDRLVLGQEGTVTHESTGRVILSGLDSSDTEPTGETNRDSERAPTEVDAAIASSPAGDRDPAAKAEVPFWSPGSSFFHYFLGFCTGLFLLMCAVAKWAYERHQAQSVIAWGGADEPAVSEPPPTRAKDRTKSKSPDSFGRNHYSKSSVFDSGLLPQDESEVDLRPNYHSLIPRKPWKKYMKFKKKASNS